jgi:hypothetical protein
MFAIAHGEIQLLVGSCGDGWPISRKNFAAFLDNIVKSSSGKSEYDSRRRSTLWLSRGFVAPRDAPPARASPMK